MNYLKHSGDLTALVNVEVTEKQLKCNYFYLHHNCPNVVTVSGEQGTFMIDVTKFLKKTPTDYAGEILIDFI
jgi:hypothetical protein